MKWHVGILGWALGLAAVVTVTEASADPASARQADKLFKQAADALALKHYDEACPKLEESDRLERAVGTEYNLAVCYELSHKPASARRKYLEAAAFARQSGKESTAKEATERAKKLDLVVPRLVIRAPADRPAGATLRCDGQPLDADAWKKPIELDPGAHRVIVMADGFATFDKVVSLVESDTTDLQVVFTPLAGGASSPAVAPPAKPEPGADPATTTSSGPFPWKWVGLGAAAVGVVGIGVGSYFALHAKGESDDSGCANGRTCPDEASASRLRTAKSDADLATILFVAGGVLTVGGGLLFFLAPSPTASSASAVRAPANGLHVKLTPAASRELTGLRVIGSF